MALLPRSVPFPPVQQKKQQDLGGRVVPNRGVKQAIQILLNFAVFQFASQQKLAAAQVFLIWLSLRQPPVVAPGQLILIVQFASALLICFCADGRGRSGRKKICSRLPIDTLENLLFEPFVLPIINYHYQYNAPKIARQECKFAQLNRRSNAETHRLNPCDNRWRTIRRKGREL